MRILFACPNNLNTFIRNSIFAIENHSQFPVDPIALGKERFWNPGEDYDIVNLHWPESMFVDWWYLDEDRVHRLCSQIDVWRRRGARVCMTRHNIKPHIQKSSIDFMKPILARLDGLIHLGQASMDEFEVRYRREPWLNSLQQTVVPHPGYFDLENQVTRQQARLSLELKQDANVVLVFGTVRSRQEIAFIKRVFRQVQLPNKVLVVPRWYRSYTKLAQLGRMFHVFHDGVPRGTAFHIGFDFVPEEKIQHYLNAADVLLVPRVTRDCLNSGVVPLALTFGRVAVGPNVGVAGEMLRESGNPTYADLQSAARAIETVLNDQQRPDQERLNREYAEQHLSFAAVGQRLGKFYSNLISAS